MKLLPLVALLALVTPAHAGSKPVLPAVDAVVADHIGSDTPGLAVLVTLHGKVLHMKGYGYSDIEQETPVDEKSQFDLASMSKNQTALAAMILIEDGVFSEDTAVADILPAFKGQDKRYRPITIGDLIHHVSGLVDYIDDEENLDYQPDMSNDTVVSYLAGQKLVRAPGTKYEYSNSGYVTLASVAAAAADEEALSDVLGARVWEPLGMTMTQLSKTPGDLDMTHVVTGYSGTNGNFEKSMELTVIQGDGSIYTNLVDLARYEKALVSHELLSEEATAALFTNGTFDNGKPLDDGDGEGYGFGWSLLTYDADNHYAMHSGSWMGTATYYQRNLDTGITVIVLANGEDAPVADLASEIEVAVEEGL